MQDAEEQQRLLSLAQADGNSQATLRSSVMAKAPKWAEFERAGLLPSGAEARLKLLHGMKLSALSESIASDPDLCAVLIEALSIESDNHTLQYTLTLLHDVVRDNASRYDSLLEVVADRDAFTPFGTILDSQNIDTYVADKSAYLLSGLICRAKFGVFPPAKVQYFLQGLSSGRYAVSEGGRLEAYCNLLKIDEYRRQVWDYRGSVDIILKGLDSKVPGASLYRSAFCVWLFSFNRDLVTALLDRGVVGTLRTCLRDSRVEKVVRVCLQTLKNLMADERAVEEAVKYNTLEILQLLEYEKWRDAELYDEIRAVIHDLQCRIHRFSNFDQYERELQSGKLRWSFLHSEKFWYENVMNFENVEFKAIKQLVALMKSEDPQTLAVATHDLGEFARLHPMGKKILQRHGVKELAMLLMSHSSREVAREALLCVQKLMLNRWQDLSYAAN